MLEELHDHERRLLRLLEWDWLDALAAPSVEEMAARIGVPSKDHVHRDLAELERTGYIMRQPGVHDGDIVILEPLFGEPRNGDMVAVYLCDTEETTLKAFYRERERIRFEPRNAALEPIWVDPSRVEIHGRLVTAIQRVAR